MTLTTIDIVKLLPIKEGLKQKILQRYDGLDADQKFAVDQAIWTAYDAVHEAHLEKNLDDAMEAVLFGKREFDQNFYLDADKKTDIELGSQSHDNLKKTDLSAVRDKLQNIIQQS